MQRDRVWTRAFPIVIITSNGEWEFPAPFLRRCLKLHVEPPTPQQLGAMVAAQFGDVDGIDRVDVARLIAHFTARSEATGGLASDQLLNAVHLAVELATSGACVTPAGSRPSRGKAWLDRDEQVHRDGQPDNESYLTSAVSGTRDAPTGPHS